MDPDTLITEARARIIWGESASAVRSFLIMNGVAEADADARIQEFNRERNAEIRKIGIKNVLIGAPLVVGAGILIYLILTSSNIGSSSVSRGKSVGVLLLGGFYGLWKLVNGIIYLLRPQSEHESITELTE